MDTTAPPGECRTCKPSYWLAEPKATRNNIRLVIKRAGFQWKQARVVLTSLDPQYREKVAAIKATLSQLADDEAVFSIDELGPVAVKTRAGKSLQGPGQQRVLPQWQKSRGSFILTVALELSKNQITHFFSERKNTTETITLIELLRKRYAKLRKLYLCWDAAPWHSSTPLKARIAFLNDWAAYDEAPEIELLPLPSGAQFLNAIESVFSGMARAILHNSDYASLDDAKAAVTRYIEDRNLAFLKDPRRAGRAIWQKERVASRFDETNNCKDPRYR